MKNLEQLAEKYSVIEEVRGKGLVLGAEFVKDRESREPDELLTALTVYHAYEKGLLIYDTGLYSNVLKFTPPLIITDSQVEQAIEILDEALEDVLAGKVDPKKIKKYVGWSS